MTETWDRGGSRESMRETLAVTPSLKWPPLVGRQDSSGGSRLWVLEWWITEPELKVDEK